MTEDNRSSKVGPAGWVALLVLAALLVAALSYAIEIWTSLSDVRMSGFGWTFLVLAAVVTFGLGAGLMALVFYSSRHDMDR